LNEVHRTTAIHHFLETPQWHTFAHSVQRLHARLPNAQLESEYVFK
jgi:ferredoxin-NADP reductase